MKKLVNLVSIDLVEVPFCVHISEAIDFSVSFELSQCTHSQPECVLVAKAHSLPIHFTEWECGDAMICPFFEITFIVFFSPILRLFLPFLFCVWSVSNHEDPLLCLLNPILSDPPPLN